MTRALSFLLVLAATALVGALVTTDAAPPAQAGETQVVVQLTAPPLALARDEDAGRRIDVEQRRFAASLRSSIPSAEVYWRYRLVANGVSVVLPRNELPRLAGLPGVRRVFAEATYHLQAGPDAATIRARELQGTTLATAGAGIKIGVIDDGVDQRHPFFDPTGYPMPDGFPKGQSAYTTAKVIVARAFPPPRATWRHASKPFDPEQSGHATHVAGIAAGNANTLAEGTRISGIAPRAYIGNYKALTIPTDANVGLDGNSAEIVAAIEAAVADGMDVINLSIGEPEIEPSRDLVALALDAAAAAGVVPVVAAGNDFDEFGRGSLSSPGSAADAITVGATTSGSAPAMASFSSSGPTPLSLRLKPDVVAPGASILSAEPDGWRALLRDEHGRPARRRRGRAPAPAPSRLDADTAQGGAHCHRTARRRRRRRRRADAGGSGPRRRARSGPAARPRHSDGSLLRARPAGGGRDRERRGRRRRRRRRAGLERHGGDDQPPGGHRSDRRLRSWPCPAP